MADLKSILDSDTSRQAVINDAVNLVETEVGSKRGPAGFAIKQGYKIVSKLKGGKMTHTMVDKMLDQFVGSLEPFYAQFQTNGGSSFAGFLNQRNDDVAEALLSATDAKRQAVDNKVLTGAYDKLRPLAKRNVKDAVPGIGDMIEKHIA